MKRVEELVAQVDGVLRLRKQLAAAKSPYDKEATERQVRVATRQLDHIVYKLYDSTEDEIAIVEGT